MSDCSPTCDKGQSEVHITSGGSVQISVNLWVVQSLAAEKTGIYLHPIPPARSRADHHLGV